VAICKKIKFLASFVLIAFNLLCGTANAVPLEPNVEDSSTFGILSKPKRQAINEADLRALGDSFVTVEEKAATYLGRKINNIVLTGNDRTQSRYLLSRLKFQQDEILTVGMAERSFKNLKNTKILKTIRMEFEPRGADNLTVVIVVEELWTTIPFLLFSSGGGSLLIVAGVVETNLFGNGALGYFTYQSLDGASSVNGQVKHPDIFGTSLELTPFFWIEEKNNEVRNFTLSRTLLAGYTSNQKTAGFFLRRPTEIPVPWLTQITPGVGIRYSNWKFSQSKISSDAKVASDKSKFINPTNTERVYYSGESELGRVDYNETLAEGAVLVYRYSLGVPTTNPSATFQEHFIAGRFFWSLPPDFLVASRFEWQKRISQNSSDEDMMGGLFHVRGLPNDIFRGLDLWFYNAEVRYMVLRQNYLNWQGVLFTDGGDTNHSKMNVQGLQKPSGAAASVGAGLRVMFPDISELTLRADYGWLLSPFRTSGLSLGVVQFVR
jgi:outer membrane protein assembly factor BamA